MDNSLIKRQDAIDALDKIFPADPMRNDYTQGITCGAALATEYIKQLPSAQPEIIRCKDCWHYPSEYADCPMIGWARNENDFCSKAERRTDEIN